MRVPSVVAFLCFGCLACATKGRDSAPSPPLAKPELPALVPLALDDSAPLPPALASQVAWQLAERGDPIDLSVLANRLGASRLAEIVREGGKAGAIALGAFEHAPDAHAQRAELCELLPRLAPPYRLRGLAGLVRVVQSDGWGEALEPDADQRCRDALKVLAPADLAADERDLASSIGVRLGAAPGVGD